MLFQGRLVRALLDGTKTVTRRPVKRLAGFGPITEFKASDTHGYDWTFRDSRMLWNDLRSGRTLAACPYGKPGDLLWVRETWRPHKLDDGTVGVQFRADGSFQAIANMDTSVAEWVRVAGPRAGSRLSDLWCPSTHMPRWACRLLLRVTEVSLERIVAITDAEIQAEGFGDSNPSPGSLIARRQGFASGWDEIYSSKPEFQWSSNPWVWVIRFERSTP